MKVERVLVCYSGHNSSTFDVSKYMARGMELAGYTVKPFRYDLELGMAYRLCDLFEQERQTKYKFNHGDAIYLASRNLIADIMLFKPDLVLVVTGLVLFGDTWQWLREVQQNLRKPFRIGLLLTESPYREEEELNISMLPDIVWTNERAFVKKLRAFNPMSFWMPHAYDEETHFPRPGTAREHDVYFCGTGHTSRVRLIGETDWTGINLRLEGVFPDLEKHMPALMPYYSEGLVPNSTVAEKFRRSAICLNKHRRECERVVLRVQVPGKRQRVECTPYKVRDGEAESLNDRALQIAACGNLQLCDTGRQELQEVFGESIPTYESPEELRDKTLYYLSHEAERERLAKMAYERGRHRTYRHNAAAIVQKVSEVF